MGGPRHAERLISRWPAPSPRPTRNVLHRDLKPANILLAEDRDAEGVRLRAGEGRIDGDGLTRTGAVARARRATWPRNRPRGRPKERPAAGRRLRPRGDPFELLTGRPPFRARRGVMIRRWSTRHPTRRAGASAGNARETRSDRGEVPGEGPRAPVRFGTRVRGGPGPIPRGSARPPPRCRLRFAARSAGSSETDLAWQWRSAGCSSSRDWPELVWDLTRPAKDPNEVALAEIQKDLAAGKPVTLLGATGTPRYARWQLGNAAFTIARNSEDACSYFTTNFGLLELLPDPGIDRYRIGATIRQLDREQVAVDEKPPNDKKTPDDEKQSDRESMCRGSSSAMVFCTSRGWHEQRQFLLRPIPRPRSLRREERRRSDAEIGSLRPGRDLSRAGSAHETDSVDLRRLIVHSRETTSRTVEEDRESKFNRNKSAPLGKLTKRTTRRSFKERKVRCVRRSVIRSFPRWCPIRESWCRRGRRGWRSASTLAIVRSLSRTSRSHP